MSRLPRLASVSGPVDVEIVVEPLARGGRVVHVRGELDLSSAADLEAALAPRERGDDLVVDLTDCTFLDSSSIRTLLAGANEVESTGGRVAVVAQAEGVRRTLEIAGVNERLAIHASLDAALD
jgi:anti-anti-sigma factor